MLKVNQKVLVRKGKYDWVPAMNKWVGKFVTISKVFKDNEVPGGYLYKIKEDKHGWLWYIDSLSTGNVWRGKK